MTLTRSILKLRPCSGLVRISFVIFALSILSMAGESPARDYFVSPNGRDSNQGTIESPLLTLKKAISMATGGDTILLRTGTYVENTVSIVNKNTSSSNKLTIKPYGNESVVIDHNGVDYGWWIENQSYIVIDGIIIRNADEGFVILGGSKYINILNSTVRDMINRGVLADDIGHSGYPEYVTIDNCTFTNIGINTAGGDIALGVNATNFTISNNRLMGNVDGVVLEGASSGHIIENNEIGNHAQEDGLDLKYTWMKTPTARSEYCIIQNNDIYGHHAQTGITVQMESRKVKIINNRIHNNRWGIWIRSKDTSDIEISQNTIYDNDDTGIIINMEATGNVRILDNVIWHNGYASTNGVKGGIQIEDGTTYEISNNIIANNKTGGATNINQVWIGSGQVSSTALDYSTYYASQNELLMRWGNSTYTSLSQIQSQASQEAHGTVIIGEYTGATAPPSTPPLPPANLRVTPTD
ncbi:MAG: right-handed parallel beta-helix repeat-containing protein [Deltaproteobacteria bacterium]|nr:right-handed parallel beta-helix repeat-containing protein [Deltaproteobacteria bacterium]